MCPLQEITATLIISILKIKTIILTSTTTKKKWQTFIKNHTLAVCLFYPWQEESFWIFHPWGWRCGWFSWTWTHREGRFRRDFSGCLNTCVRKSSVFFHVLTTTLQALWWGTLRALLLSRGIPRGCWWGTPHHPRGGGRAGRGGRKKIMQDAPGGWERKKGRWKRNKI